MAQCELCHREIQYSYFTLSQNDMFPTHASTENCNSLTYFTYRYLITDLSD